MTARIVTAFVTLALLDAFVLGYAYGFDVAAVSIFIGLVLVGGLAIAIARAKERGITQPAQCPSCGGLLSPNAPYCKHCNEPL